MSEPDRTRRVETGVGTAIVDTWQPAGAPNGALLFGHGAGGALGAGWPAGLTELTDLGLVVHRVEQPWRVAGKRVAPAPATLDVAWCDVVSVLRAEGELAGGRCVVGGRSAGARVACRTATHLDAHAVLLVSFPLHPPGRPDRSRAAELLAPAGAELPVLVVQGATDPFGSPDEIADAAAASPVREVAARITVVRVDGPHTPSRPEQVVEAAREWLRA